ncbi:type I phosphomannose isomerase catalytic subunit [Marinilabilia salmonicolor]|uniref:type I phosphomannose isomerase catalytic subunit n=1 Tax=Marinilabilia salmonicolor TaxID=989 RepID=UPI000299DDDE|nr:type I phosphomannose isomerase catalytic subunit [Marinilabilia salmonicolor]
MERKLYPLKFEPILKQRLWGGTKLNTVLNKSIGEVTDIGESWELSGVPGDVSVVSNGFLKGNSLSELLEIYMSELVGDKVFEKYGNEFPLLIKFIDANDVLSIQVHPDDKLARSRHNSFGKTEMWYVMQADKGASLISGFKKDTGKEEYLKALENKKLDDLLASHEVEPGDVFFIPAGRVHAIGKGILLAEIQQTSDVTYRIYDFDRRDAEGNARELHTAQALDAIDFSGGDEYRTQYKAKENEITAIVESPYFVTSLIDLKGHELRKDIFEIDSFVILMCMEGSADIIYNDGQKESVKMGETVLVPADLKEFTIKAEHKCKMLEVHMPDVESESKK